MPGGGIAVASTTKPLRLCFLEVAIIAFKPGHWFSGLSDGGGSGGGDAGTFPVCVCMAAVCPWGWLEAATSVTGSVSV